MTQHVTVSELSADPVSLVLGRLHIKAGATHKQRISQINTFFEKGCTYMLASSPPQPSVVLLTSEETSTRKHTTRLLPCYVARVKELREVFSLQASKLIRGTPPWSLDVFSEPLALAEPSRVCCSGRHYTTRQGAVQLKSLDSCVCNLGSIHASGHTAPCSYLRPARPWHRGQSFYL